MYLICNPSTHPAPRWLADGLAREGEGIAYYTGFGLARDNSLYRALPEGVRRVLAPRVLPEHITGESAHSIAPLRETGALLARRYDLNTVRGALLKSRRASVQRAVMKRVLSASNPPAAVVGLAYMTDALANFCADRGIPYIAYMPQPHPDTLRRLLGRAIESESRLGLFDESPDLLEDTLVASAAGLRAASGFIAASGLVERSLRDAGLTQPMLVAPLGVDPSEALTSAEPSTPTAKRLLYVGRLTAQKGLAVLFESLGQLGKGYQLRVVSPDYRRVQEIATDKYPGLNIVAEPPVPRVQLYRIYAESDMLVLPSWYEGFGLVLVEALRSGLPVVATSMTAAADLHVHERGGLVIEPGDPDGLAKAISTIGEDRLLRAKFSSGARQISDGLTWQDYQAKVAPALIELVQTLDGAT